MDGSDSEIGVPSPNDVEQTHHDKETDIDVVDLSKVPATKRWGRPYTKPDGSIMTIDVEAQGQWIDVVVGGVTQKYERDDVSLLGNGNFESGVVKIGRAAFNDTRKPTELWGGQRVLQEEIDKLKTK